MSEQTADISAPRRGVVVDDDAANLYYAGKLLRNRGYEIVPVSNYYEALRVLSVTNTDLLLADIRLDVGSGLELARIARERFTRLKILLMTAYREEELNATVLGIPVIRIPFTSRALVNSVHRLFLE